MARAAVVPLRPRTPRFTPAILVEPHMEAAEAARRVLAFTETELRTSFEAGDIRRLRTLQSVHRDATTILAEHRRQSAWADAACADGLSTAGHGVAA